MQLKDFFIENPIFTSYEFSKYASAHGCVNLNSQQSALGYHRQKKNIVRIRKGLYAVAPKAPDNKKFIINPYLLASKLSSTSIIAYHSALAFHGLTEEDPKKISYLSKKYTIPLIYQDYHFISAKHPRAVIKLNQMDTGVETYHLNGIPIQVTSLERTLVDVFDRIHLSGGWYVAWKCLSNIEAKKLDEEKILAYCRVLNNYTANAKVGVFLEAHAERFGISQSIMDELSRLSPRSAHYVNRKMVGGRLMNRWNLIIPEDTACDL